MPHNFLIYLVWHTVRVKYCHDCLTPINRNSPEEYCSFCKRDRESKKNPDAVA